MNHALIIAVEQYIDSGIPQVEYAAADVRELSTVIRQHGFTDDSTTLLVNDSATKARVESALHSTIATLKEDDRFMIYYAGHSFSQNGKNYLSCHDSFSNDLPTTSISLRSVIDDLQNSKCGQITIFLDCHNGESFISGDASGPLSAMTDSDIEEFCDQNAHYAVFKSCQSGERSYSSLKLKHGIWAYHVIEAFRGDNEQALDKDHRLTAASLRKYLDVAVPSTVNNNFTGLQAQSPHMSGSKPEDVVLADFTKIFAAREKAAHASFAHLSKTSFYGATSGHVKRLSGFRKHFRIPASVSESSRNFVKGLGGDDVNTASVELFNDLKTYCGYKRREISMECDTSSAMLITPDFTVYITLDIDDDPKKYIITTEVTAIKNQDVIESESFGMVFNMCFDRIVVEFEDPVSIETIIDYIEDLECTDDVSIDYPPEAYECTVKIKGYPAKLHFQANSLTLQTDRKTAVGVLLDVSRQLSETQPLQGIARFLPGA